MMIWDFKFFENKNRLYKRFSTGLTDRKSYPHLNIEPIRFKYKLDIKINAV
jgi:hypothetical protein